MRQIKTYHIHTDFKFVNSIERFEGGEFENFNIFITDDYKLGESLGSDILIFKISELDLVIRLCSSADLVVLYDLDLFKSKLALSLPKEVKIAWRFFGYELYSKNRSKYLSNRTYKAYLGEGNSFINKLQEIKKRINYFSYIPGTNNYLFKKSISRVDIFLGLSVNEYNELKKKWKTLPPFIKLSIHPPKSNVNSVDFGIKKSKKTILIGNSKSSYNNHLDVLDIIEKSSNKNNYNYMIPFNYGNENSYTEIVRGECEKKTYLTLVEEFMSLKKFNQFYKTVGALILNNYRQMAMGNIRFAFLNGVKVYLNTKNVFFQELTNIGYIVFNIDNLLDDLNSGNVFLREEDANNNFNKLIETSESYTREDFKKKLLEKIVPLQDSGKYP